MDEYELMALWCKDAGINPNEGVYVVRGEDLILPMLRLKVMPNPKIFKALYDQTKVTFMEVMLQGGREVLEAGVDSAITMAWENIREASQHPQDTA